MQDNTDASDEQVDGLLVASDQSSSNNTLRATVFAKTVSVIRFRRRLKRCALAASLVGCYLAGIASTAAWPRAKDSSDQPSTEQVVTRQVPSPPPSPTSPPTSPPLSPLIRVDRQIAQDKSNRVEVLRRSADRNLLEDGDVKSAVRNYEQILDLSSAEQRAISPRQDNWLLMALKDARSKEMKHDRLE